MSKYENWVPEAWKPPDHISLIFSAIGREDSY